MGGKFGPKVGQIGPKWDKSGIISDQISVHFDSSEFKRGQIVIEQIFNF